jgi:hypothetical protein
MCVSTGLLRSMGIILRTQKMAAPDPPLSNSTGRDLPRPGRGPDHDQDNPNQTRDAEISRPKNNWCLGRLGKADGGSFAREPNWAQGSRDWGHNRKLSRAPKSRYSRPTVGLSVREHQQRAQGRRKRLPATTCQRSGRASCYGVRSQFGPRGGFNATLLGRVSAVKLLRHNASDISIPLNDAPGIKTACVVAVPARRPSAGGRGAWMIRCNWRPAPV